MADAILFLHFCVVVFIVSGLPLIYLGAALQWSWVREWRWRAIHAGAIVFVAAEAVLGVACPLTVWEDQLRGEASGVGFVERWVHRVMFYDAPEWVFTVAYVGFAALVAMSWIIVRPIRQPKQRL